MTRLFFARSYLLAFFIPLVLILTLVVLLQSGIGSGNGTSFAFFVTFDLLLTIPLIYFLLIRNTSIPKTTVVPVMVLGMLVGYWLLPEQEQLYLNQFKAWGLPFIELGVAYLIISKVRKAMLLYKSKAKDTRDFFTTLKEVCVTLFPKPAVSPIVTEIAVFYYGFFKWKRSVVLPNEFTNHEKSNTTPLLMGGLLVVGIETFVLHKVIFKWSEPLAWLISILSVYTLFQIFGVLKALPYRRTVIGKKAVALRYSILAESVIDIENIEAVELMTKDLDEDNKDYSHLSPLGELEGHNVVIHLREPVNVTGLYGMTKHCKGIALFLDEPDRFKQLVEQQQSDC